MSNLKRNACILITLFFIYMYWYTDRIYLYSLILKQNIFTREFIFGPYQYYAGDVKRISWKINKIKILLFFDINHSMCWLLLFSSGWKIFSVLFHFSDQPLFALFVHVFKSTDIHTGGKKCLDSTGQLLKQIWDKYYGHVLYYNFIHLWKNKNDAHQLSIVIYIIWINR